MSGWQEFTGLTAATSSSSTRNTGRILHRSLPRRRRSSSNWHPPRSPRASSDVPALKIVGALNWSRRSTLRSPRARLDPWNPEAVAIRRCCGNPQRTSDDLRRLPPNLTSSRREGASNMFEVIEACQQITVRRAVRLLACLRARRAAWLRAAVGGAPFRALPIRSTGSRCSTADQVEAVRTASSRVPGEDAVLDRGDRMLVRCWDEGVATPPSPVPGTFTSGWQQGAAAT